MQTLGPAGYAPTLDVAAEAHGGASVAWAGGDGATVTRRTAGRGFERPVAFRGVTPALTTGPDGRAYVAFATPPPGEAEEVAQPFIAVAARDPDGRWSAPRQVSGRPAAQPRVAVAGDGAVVVAWRESSFDTDEMPRYGGVGAAIATAAGDFGPPLHVAGARTTGLLLSTARSGETVLAWSSPTDQTGPLDYAVRVPSTATFGRARRMPGASADLALGRGEIATLDDGTTLFVGPDGPRIGVRLAVRAPGGRFAAARLVVGRGYAPIVATAESTATIVYLQGHGPVVRYVTVSRRSGASGALAARRRRAASAG